MTWRARLRDLAEAARVTLLRLVGLAYIAFSILVWGQLLGVSMPFMRDPTLVEGPVRAVAVVLAVMGPVTAVGLWSLASWGQVVWAMTMAVHTLCVMRGWPVSQAPGVVLAFHLACLAAFALAVLARLVANEG